MLLAWMCLAASCKASDYQSDTSHLLHCYVLLLVVEAAFNYNVCVCLPGISTMAPMSTAVAPSQAAQEQLPASACAQLDMSVVPQKASPVAQEQRAAAISQPQCQGM